MCNGRSAAPTANPSTDTSNAEQLFNQFLQAREEGDDEQALEYVKESMDLGYLPAMREYGNIMMMEDGSGFEYVRRAAQGGDIPSMVRLGLHYFQGCGTEADVDQAAHYWEIAARYGAPEAKLKLAELYIMGLGEDQDYDEGLRLLDEAIKELPETPDAEHFINNPDWNLGEALFWKGIIYYYGLGQEQNRHSAMMYFKLAKKGFPVADNVVDDGEDPREALKGYGYPCDPQSWWEIYCDSDEEEEDEDDEFPYAEEEDKYDEWGEEEMELAHAAMMGDIQSLVKIGNMVCQWDGYMPLLDIAINHDPEYESLYKEGYEHWRNDEYMDAADSFFTPACNGNTDAMLMIGRCWFSYWESDDGDEETCWSKAFEWFLKSACNLNENAMYYLGEAYYYGRVPNEDGEFDYQSNYEAAAFWFKHAAYHWEHVNPRHCHADAANYLGTMYDDGLIDGRKDPVKAVECYKRATELSDRTLAWYNLGMAYEFGKGVPENLDKAMECYRKVADFNWDAEARYGILLYNRAGTRDQQNRAIEHLKHAAEMSSIAENALKQLGINH